MVLFQNNFKMHLFNTEIVLKKKKKNLKLELNALTDLNL